MNNRIRPASPVIRGTMGNYTRQNSVTRGRRPLGESRRRRCWHRRVYPNVGRLNFNFPPFRCRLQRAAYTGDHRFPRSRCVRARAIDSRTLRNAAETIFDRPGRDGSSLMANKLAPSAVRINSLPGRSNIPPLPRLPFRCACERLSSGALEYSLGSA